MGDVLKTLGKIAPFAASVIPGIGPIAGAAIGAGSQLLSGGGAKGALQGAAEGAGSSMFHGGVPTMLKQGFGTMNESGTWTPDVAKILAGVGGISGLIGQQQQRRSAQNYANAEIAQRNALMSQILGRQNYGFNPNEPNLNAQSNTANAPAY